MYSTCLYCNNDLGANEVVESFPVGRRLAFDQSKGRLWVVCRKCEKWNLTPFEERWEAIETCERLYHDARKRVSTDNIGLARLNEGLELVRIGEPMRPEFAAWRYGDQFGRRRRKMIIIGTGVALVGGGALVAGMAAGGISGGGYGLWQLAQGIVRGARRRRRLAVVNSPDGAKLTVRGRHAEKARVVLPQAGGEGWALFLPHTAAGHESTVTLYGEHARRATALIMPKVNLGGASRDRVQKAVKGIELAGTPEHFLNRLARNSRLPSVIERKETRWYQYESGPSASDKKQGNAGLSRLDLETRLGIEMAVNEENERAALEGELALLELEWKEAEELAGIADTLGVPESVEVQFEEMRRKSGRDGGNAGTP